MANEPVRPQVSDALLEAMCDPVIFHHEATVAVALDLRDARTIIAALRTTPMPDAFLDYVQANYPGPRTIISNPKWHAPRLWEAAMRALAAARPEGETPA